MMSITAGLTPPPAPNWSEAQLSQTSRDLSMNGTNLAVPYKTNGEGSQAVWAYSPQSETATARDFSAHGYNAVRLAPTQFQSSYKGGLLKEDFRLTQVDFKA